MKKNYNVLSLKKFYLKGKFNSNKNLILLSNSQNTLSNNGMEGIDTQGTLN